MALDPITAALSIGSQIIDRLWPDPVQRDAAKLKLLELQQSGELQKISGQLAVNLAEAKNANWIVAGWRPYIGWICGTGLAIQFVAAPLADWATALFHHPVAVPPLDLGTLMTLLLGMLGLGGMRTAEKLKNVQGNH